jgi:hypothetical protein
MSKGFLKNKDNKQTNKYQPSHALEPSGSYHVVTTTTIHLHTVTMLKENIGKHNDGGSMTC